MKELYNLMWVYPMLAKKETVNVSRVCDIQKNNTQALVSVIGVDAVILYPALLTPAVVVGKSDLEILLLIKDGQDLDESNVNQQFKISPGLDAMKPYLKDPLFKEAYFLKIKIEDLQFNDNVIKGKGFSGILDKRAIEFYKKEKYNQLKLVTIDTGELFGFSRGGKQENLNKINQKSDQKEIQPKEKQDELLWKRLKDINGKGLPFHSFNIKKSDDVDPDVDLTDVNWNCPIQSFHPVCYYDSMAASNLFVLGDIHVSSRQHVLMGSNARVIENDDRDDLSPEIGKLVNCSSRNFINLLNNGGGASDVDMVWIVGDFVDFIKNIYPIKSFSNPTQVWDAVALNDSYKNRYLDCVDYISVYSIVVDFYKQHKKPIFGVKGNHDCYSEPYGISPRLVSGKFIKANEGIPADHNLTFYEALLAFGNTYGEIKKSFNFNKDKFEWFALMLSPLADFSLELPKQVFVGLGWGDKEDLTQSTDDIKQGIGGHLPRADGSISAKQLVIINDALKKKKKVILASHFTFISYKEKISENISKTGNTVVPGDYGICDMGTFEINRDEVLGSYLGTKKDIQCVISGHSHRRAAYEIVKAEKITETLASGESGDVYSYDKYTLRTKMHVFEKYNGFNPVIIVTDSAGPIPRRNIIGEFKEHGSDTASGTKVVFDKGSGNVSAITRVPSGCERAKPRIAVAIDYYDIMEEQVIAQFQAETFENDKLLLGIMDDLSFSFVINKKLIDWGVRISKISLSLYDGASWHVIEFSKTDRNKVWSIKGKDGRLLYRLALKGQEEIKIYLSFFFDDSGVPNLSAYSFRDCWNIESEMDYKKVSTEASILVLKRNSDYKEKPNYKDRTKIFTKYKI